MAILPSKCREIKDSWCQVSSEKTYHVLAKFLGIQKRFSGNVWEMSRKAVGEICWNLADNLVRKIVE